MAQLVGNEATQFKPGKSGNTKGQPKRKDSIRTQLRFLTGITKEDRERLAKTPFSGAQELALKRFELAELTEDYRCIDSLADQLEGRPDQERKLTGDLKVIVEYINPPGQIAARSEDDEAAIDAEFID